MLALLPAPRAAALTGGPVTIDLDTTDVEDYGRAACTHARSGLAWPRIAWLPWPQIAVMVSAVISQRPSPRCNSA